MKELLEAIRRDFAAARIDQERPRGWFTASPAGEERLRQRIALIHAVRVAMQPVEDAFLRHWPEAERINLLDDALSVDRDQAGALTAELSGRISALANYAVGAGASGILYTCSAFGAAIEAVKERLRMPVLKPNEAMLARRPPSAGGWACSPPFPRASSRWRRS